MNLKIISDNLGFFTIAIFILVVFESIFVPGKSDFIFAVGLGVFLFFLLKYQNLYKPFTIFSIFLLFFSFFLYAYGSQLVSEKFGIWSFLLFVSLVGNYIKYAR